MRRGFAKPASTETKTVPTKEQSTAARSTPVVSATNRSTFRRYLNDLHQRYRPTTDKPAKSHDLLLARTVVITVWLFVIIIEFVTYSNAIKSSNLALKFLFSAAVNPLKEITSILYASGSAAYGVSFEIYLVLPIAIANCALAIVNCGINHSETPKSIIYSTQTVLLFTAVELGHQNFKRFKFQQSYKSHYQAATRAMLSQSLYFSVTIMFFASPVLRAVYNGLRLKCPYRNQIANGSHCSIIEIDRPIFDDNESCASDFTALVTGREHLRAIRDIVFLNIAFYSMYNKAFLDIIRTNSRIHKILLILFAAMSCGVVVANVDPWQFSNIRLYFSSIEIIIFAILIALLAINLRKKYDYKKDVIMEEHPTIFG